MKVSFIALFKSMKRKNDPGFLVRIDLTAYNLNHLFFFDVVSAPTIAVLVTIFSVRLSPGVYSERIPPWKAPKEVGSGWKKRARWFTGKTIPSWMFSDTYELKIPFRKDIIFHILYPRRPYARCNSLETGTITRNERTTLVHLKQGDEVGWREVPKSPDLRLCTRRTYDDRLALESIQNNLTYDFCFENHSRHLHIWTLLFVIEHAPWWLWEATSLNLTCSVILCLAFSLYAVIRCCISFQVRCAVGMINYWRVNSFGYGHSYRDGGEGGEKCWGYTIFSGRRTAQIKGSCIYQIVC